MFVFGFAYISLFYYYCCIMYLLPCHDEIKIIKCQASSSLGQNLGLDRLLAVEEKEE